jgi:hypothetical protein
MSKDEPSKQAGIARLISDLRSAKIELLSAQCATDRLRLQYSVADIVSFGERQALKTQLPPSTPCAASMEPSRAN